MVGAEKATNFDCQTGCQGHLSVDAASVIVFRFGVEHRTHPVTSIEEASGSPVRLMNDVGLLVSSASFLFNLLPGKEMAS